MATKLTALVDRLIDRTEDGKVDWEPTETDGEFLAAFPSYAVRLHKRPNRQSPSQDDYIVTIYDDFGAVVESVDDMQLREQGMDDPYGRLKVMYEKVRRKAMGVDEAIDQLLDFLSDD